MTDTPIAYLQWAKLTPRGQFNLTRSGVPHRELVELNVDVRTLQLSGADNSYGYAPLLQAIAAHYGVNDDCVAYAHGGTSMANWLVAATFIEPGDHVIVEHPTYEPLLAVCRRQRAQIERFYRREENQWAVDPDEISRKLKPNTKLIVLTELHNPTGVRSDAAVIRKISELAARSRAHVLIDEVYLEFIGPAKQVTNFRADSSVIVTSSLTKVYGLDQLRCGWVIATPDIVRRVWQTSDYFYGSAPFITEQLALAAFARLETFRREGAALADRNGRCMKDFLARRSDLHCVPPAGGTVWFPRLLKGRTRDFDQRVFERFDTRFVPGEFFEMPEHMRIGTGIDTATLQAGLTRLGQALDELN